MSQPTKGQVKRPSLSIEQLEKRENQSVSQVWFSGNMLVVKTDNVGTTLEIHQSGTNVKVTEGGSNRSWQYAASTVGSVQLQGGSGNDRFVDYISNLRVMMYGNGGADYLEGYNAADYFDGGAGDDTIKGYGGDDIIFGGLGNDTLLGMDGNDQLMGGDNDDHLNGGAGADKLWGDYGNDVLISIDGGTGDYVEGGAGKDSLWVDQVGSSKDSVYGATSDDKVQNVASFANGADRTLNGDRITDPTLEKSGQSYKRFSGNPLFSTSGPEMDDVDQGTLGDCWLLAGLGAIAMDSPQALKHNIVDFDDGTYGVRLGDKFYRVDDDLPVASSTSTRPANADLGNQNSMWVAVVEKAFAHYRTGANSYASLNGGWSIEVNRAFGSTSAGSKSIQSYTSATALANDLFAKWNTYQSVTIGFTGLKKATSTVPNLITGHMYTVARFNRDSAGNVTSIVLRNPWGVDGAGSDSNVNDGYVTVTASQLMLLVGEVNWGRV